MTHFKAFVATFALFVASLFTATAQVPPVPEPARLVNDFAGIFTQEQVDSLERRLVDFNDTTTNVICVVTMEDLGGMTPSEMAYEIGDKWGVKSKDKNNGIVILVKPKNETNGEVYISVGYDLEAVIPDVTAKQITSREMVPFFKENDYYSGVVAAIDKLMPLAAGEISADRLYEEEGSIVGTIIGVLFFGGLVALLFYGLFSFIRKVGGISKGGDGGSSSGSSSSRSSRSYSSGRSYSSSSSSSSRSSGSFGGYSGRGGFGGGGGGSSW